MFTSKRRNTVAGVWCALFVAVAVAAVLSGVSITIPRSVLWLVACVVPPTVLLMVWRGGPPPTVAEILYAVERRQ